MLASIAPENMLITEVAGQAIGYNRLTYWQEDDGLYLYLYVGKVLPAYRHQGIGSALLKWSERRIHELIVEKTRCS